MPSGRINNLGPMLKVSLRSMGFSLTLSESISFLSVESISAIRASAFAKYRRWRTVRDELFTHQRTTVIMIDAEDQIHHIRVSGIPESEHTKIYQLLKVKDPLKRNHQWVGKRL